MKRKVISASTIVIAAVLLIYCIEKLLQPKKEPAVRWQTEDFNGPGDSAIITNDLGDRKVIPVMAVYKLRNSTDNTSVSITPPVGR